MSVMNKANEEGCGDAVDYFPALQASTNPQVLPTNFVRNGSGLETKNNQSRVARNN